jgi:hypothetical protein
VATLTATVRKREKKEGRIVMKGSIKGKVIKISKNYKC